jgi:transposase
MTISVRRSSIVPPGFRVDRISIDGLTTCIEARGVSATGQCPFCGSISARVHSRYRRQLADLPFAGRVVRVSLTARRFRCMTALCSRRIFTERFSDDVLAPRARRTAEAMLTARGALWKQYCKLHDLVVKFVSRSELCRRFTAIRGVGPVTALSQRLTILRDSGARATSPPILG